MVSVGSIPRDLRPESVFTGFEILLSAPRRGPGSGLRRQCRRHKEKIDDMSRQPASPDAKTVGSNEKTNNQGTSPGRGENPEENSGAARSRPALGAWTGHARAAGDSGDARRRKVDPSGWANGARAMLGGGGAQGVGRLGSAQLQKRGSGHTRLSTVPTHGTILATGYSMLNARCSKA